jgi:deoxyribodipyrimidine photo-lyase
MSGRTAIVLFTRDLRVHDHAPLHDAARWAERIVPLFVLDDELLRHEGSANRLAFLLDALVDLRRTLRALGADLVVRRGDPVEETMRAARDRDAAAVFVGADASTRARRRELRLARACDEGRLLLRVEQTTTVVPPGELAPSARDHYRVFTPYWRRWRAEPLPAVLPPPDRLALPAGVAPGALPRLRELTESRPSQTLPRGGEREGRRLLERWLADGLGAYERTRDELATQGTSHLSPYLHFGCISPAETVARALDRGDPAEAFVRQLSWRDFFHQLLAANPAMQRDDLVPRGDEWNDDPEALARWREGRTGYPIVDAAMRQLDAEGWMHNRARLIVGSFLTKTLYVDWRRGAQVFADLLVDADVGNNVGNWQWIAGTGADTRPNRVLNAIVQGKRFDPDGAYVRRYVPELEGLDGATVHEPWRMRTELRPPGYPSPMVDHAEAAVRFRRRRAALRGGTASR